MQSPCLPSRELVLVLCDHNVQRYVLGTHAHPRDPPESSAFRTLFRMFSLSPFALDLLLSMAVFLL